jgi:EpsI family protein
VKNSLFVSLVLGIFMVLASGFTLLVTPTAVSVGQVNLEAIIPAEFGDWKIDTTLAMPLVNPEANGLVSKLYNQTLSRTYINKQGERIMLAIAYGADQSTDLHVHRPEICYRSGGFNVSALAKTFVDTTIGRIPVMHLVATQGRRNEPITYWIRVGDSLTRGWFEQKFAAFSYGLAGKVPDGLLFRVSTISNDEQDSFRIQQAFLTALLQAVRSEDRYLLVGKMS